MTVIVKTEGEKSASYGWLQFEKSGMKELQKLATKAPMAMAVLLYLTSNMSRTNAIAVSQKAIAANAGISLRAVTGAIKLLGDHRFIEIIKVGGLSVFRINTRVAWQGNRGERYAHFTAEIIAMESEQQKGMIDFDAPLKSVPVLHEGERLLVGNEATDPPDQQEMELP
jgi:Firmicute plasmid replication protein (RepL)